MLLLVVVAVLLLLGLARVRLCSSSGLDVLVRYCPKTTAPSHTLQVKHTSVIGCSRMQFSTPELQMLSLYAHIMPSSCC